MSSPTAPSPTNTQVSPESRDVSPSKMTEGTVTSSQRMDSKEALKNIQKRRSTLRRNKRKASKEQAKRIYTLPESVMMEFEPRSIIPLGFDGCNDGNQKFVLPPGYEFDQQLEELCEDLNTVQKPKTFKSNLMGIVSIGSMIGTCYYLQTSLQSQGLPIMAVAILGNVLIWIPFIIILVYTVKDWEVDRFIKRLMEKIPEERGVVHFEKLQYGRTEVWNHPFDGHRTGITQRTAIAVEIFLRLPEVKTTAQKNSQQMMQQRRGVDMNDVQQGKVFDLTDDQNKEHSKKFEELMKIQKVTTFLREIGLGRLQSQIRRNNLTFERIDELTDQDWREAGIDPTEKKLIKVHMIMMDEADRQRNQQMQGLKQQGTQSNSLQRTQSNQTQPRKSEGRGELLVNEDDLSEQEKGMESSPLQNKFKKLYV